VAWPLSALKFIFRFLRCTGTLIAHAIALLRGDPRPMPTEVMNRPPLNPDIEALAYMHTPQVQSPVPEIHGQRCAGKPTLAKRPK
jgi:hypothetical protein